VRFFCLKAFSPVQKLLNCQHVYLDLDLVPHIFLVSICLNDIHYYVLLQWAPALMGISPSGCLHCFFVHANKLSPVLNRTLGNELSPSGTIVGSISRVTTVNTHSPSTSKSSFSVSCYVLFGLPTLLLPSSGIHSKARLAGLVVGSRRM